MTSSPPALDRFLLAQSEDYATALAELRRGRKEGHWVWYVLPQLRGLGLSAMSVEYGIADLAEARAFLAHPVLGPRLRECVSALCAHTDASAAEILGGVDAMKFRSCLTLFAAAATDPESFHRALRLFFEGQADPKTIERLAAPGGAEEPLIQR